MAKPRLPKKSVNGNINGAEVSSAARVPSSPVPAAAEMVSTASAEPASAARKTTVRKSTRKPAIVKTESRSNLYSINLEEEIRRRAYLLSERRGFEPGHETEDWFNAEHEVRERYQHQSMATA